MRSFRPLRAAKYSLQGIGRRRRRTLSSDRRMSKTSRSRHRVRRCRLGAAVRLFDPWRSSRRRAGDAGRPAHHHRPLLAPDARRSRKRPPGRSASFIRSCARAARPRSCRSATSDRISKTPARSAATRRSSSDRPTSRWSTPLRRVADRLDLRGPGIPRHVGRTGRRGNMRSVAARGAAGEAARVQRAVPPAVAPTPSRNTAC